MDFLRWVLNENDEIVNEGSEMIMKKRTAGSNGVCNCNSGLKSMACWTGGLMMLVEKET